MESIGIDEASQHQIFSLLSGILHLGNVNFKEDDAEGQVGGVTEEAEPAFQSVAAMLGVEVRLEIFSICLNFWNA